MSASAKLAWLRAAAADKSGAHHLWPIEWAGVGRSQYIPFGGRSIATPLNIACTLAHGPPVGAQRFAVCDCAMAVEGCLSGACVRWVSGRDRMTSVACNHARGSRIGNAKLDEVRVAAILRSTEPYRVIARREGVSTRTIKAIRLCEAWKHVPRPEGYDCRAGCVVGAYRE